MTLAHDAKENIERTIHQRFNVGFFSRDHHPLVYRSLPNVDWLTSPKLHIVPLCIRILSDAMMIQFASLTRSDIGRSGRSTSYHKANVAGTHESEFLNARRTTDRISGAVRLNWGPNSNQCLIGTTEFSIRENVTLRKISDFV